MERQPLHQGWEHRVKVSRFLEMTGSAQPWTDVTLPHDAMVTRPRDPSKAAWAPVAYFSPGADEYRLLLDAPADWSARYVAVTFEGIYRNAMVYLNDTLVASRPSGYAEITAHLSPHLRFGQQNQLRVECRTYDDSRWYTGAGLYRNVCLVVADPVHIALDGVGITTPQVSEELAMVAVRTEVENHSGGTRRLALSTELLDPDGQQVAADTVPVTVCPGQHTVLSQRLAVPRPARWSVANPSLYTCASTLLDDHARRVDETVSTFGIRSLTLDPYNGLCVNGQAIKLRGACVHHDNGPIGAATIDRAEQRRVELLKAAGFNALRSAHQPMSRAMLDACDRLGVLVMDEAFDTWTQHKTDHDYASDFSEWWEADIAQMVRKDRNHPSVVLYSIGNEIQEAGSPAGASWARRIAEKVRSLDPTRFTLLAVNPLLLLLDDLDRLVAQIPPDTPQTAGINTAMSWFEGLVPKIVASEESAQRTEEAFGAVEVAGYNYAASCYQVDHERFPQRVMVGSETCPPDIDRNWALVTEHGHLIGDFTWTGWDYLGEVGVGRVDHGEAPGSTEGPAGFMAPYPWLTAWVGDLDITGHRRPVSYWREIVFGLRADPYVAVRPPQHHGQEVRHASPWAWSDAIASWSWRGHEGDSVCVEVYADADDVELFLDGRSMGHAPAGPAQRYRALFEVTYQPGTLAAVARRAGAEVGRCELTSPSGQVYLQLQAERAVLQADHGDLAFVEVTLVDRAGNLWSDGDRAVHVELEGPAVVQGFASANPCTEEPFDASTHTTFHGRALVVLRPTGDGPVTLTARAPGLAPASVRLAVVPPGRPGP